MQSQSAKAHVRAEHAPVRVSPVERHLNRYCPRLRPRVKALARRHPYLADLAVSFPALLFALAIPRRGFDPEPAIAHVVAGLGLATLARQADVPLWLRALPPEAFVTALRPMPDDTAFRKRIANCLPRTCKAASAWLHDVAEAIQVGNCEIALWIAAESHRDPKAIDASRLRAVCLYAWFSGQPGTYAHGHIEILWRPAMQFAAADTATQRWLERLELMTNLGDGVVDDMWLRPGHVDGYTFVPLQTAGDMIAEAKAMHNCLIEYGHSVAAGSVRLWGIRFGGHRIATLELANRGECGVICIGQLKGFANTQVPIEVKTAARRWFFQPTLSAVDHKHAGLQKCQIERKVWSKLWKPYWLSKRSAPAWLPRTPSRKAFKKI